MKPRAVQRKQQSQQASGSTSSKPLPPPPSSSSAPTASTSTFLVPRSVAKPKQGTGLTTYAPPIASTSKVPPSDAAPPPLPAAQTTEDVDSPAETEKLLELLYNLEWLLSDYGLSLYLKDDLLPKLRDSPDGYVHLQSLLFVQMIKGFVKSQANLQKALQVRHSDVLEVSPNGFQVRRRIPPDYKKLATMEPAEWEPLTLYLENIPSTSSHSSHSLTTIHNYLSSHLLQTPLHRVFFPALFNPENPTLARERDRENAAHPELRARLPMRGGPLKGFAMVVVKDREAAERILESWKWDRGEEVVKREPMDEDGHIEVGEAQKAAVASGLRSLTSKAYSTLKAEYLSYQASILHLSAAQASTSSAPQTSAPRPSRSTATNSTPAFPQQQAKALNLPQDEKGKTVVSPLKKLELPASEGEAIPGAFPKGCVLWIRNLNPEITKKGNLKSSFAGLLEELREGAGKGVEHVEYEKGLDTCYLRFSSSQLAKLVLDHLSSTPTIQTQTSKKQPPTLTPSTTPNSRLAAQLLTGLRETRFWEAAPESTRRAARVAIASTTGAKVGVVDVQSVLEEGLVKKKEKFVKSEEKVKEKKEKMAVVREIKRGLEELDREDEEEEGRKRKKRKNPSKFE